MPSVSTRSPVESSESIQEGDSNEGESNASIRGSIMGRSIITPRSSSFHDDESTDNHDEENLDQNAFGLELIEDPLVSVPVYIWVRNKSRKRKKLIHHTSIKIRSSLEDLVTLCWLNS